MTLDEFLVELSKRPKDWSIDSSGRIRSKKLYECPITCFEDVSCGAAESVGIKLGLPTKLIGQIIEAADDFGEDEQLRARLLEACGLSAPSK